MEWNGMEWNGMEWNGIFSNRYIHTIMDCDKYCQDIENKIYRINQEKREIVTNITGRLTQKILDRTNKLDDNYEKLSDELKVCIADCERRNRHSGVSVNEYVPPINEELRKKLEQYDSDDDADGLGDLGGLGGGNKRRRRRSFRNKTKRTQRRGRQQQRNQKRNTRRGRTRRHITPHNHMK